MIAGDPSPISLRVYAREGCVILYNKAYIKKKKSISLSFRNRCTCGGIRVRNRTAACGPAARGAFPGPTSSRGTVARTRASSRTGATCATNGSRGPTIWPNTRGCTTSADTPPRPWRRWPADRDGRTANSIWSNSVTRRSPAPSRRHPAAVWHVDHATNDDGEIYHLGSEVIAQRKNVPF